MTLRFALALVLGAVALAAYAPAGRPPPPIREETAFKIGTDAYVYGYPLVTMELTRRVMTNVAAPTGKLAPMGQFANLRTYPSPADKEVTAPNADTLYSLAWLDLSGGPYVFRIPDADERYYLMPMLSGWTDVFEVPGKRTTGTEAQGYAITGPKWKGKLPAGLQQFKSPTSLVWILGRTYCTGTPEDYEPVHAFQAKLSLVPLSAYGKAYTPPRGKVDPAIDMKTPVREQVNKMSAGDYFKLLARLMKANPPAKADAPMVARMARLGLVPGKDFDITKLRPAVVRALERAPKAGLAKIMAHAKEAGTLVNGWTFSLRTGRYKTDYLQRAYVTAVGLGANRPSDAVYPMTEVDESGKRLSGANKYEIRFAKGQTPPVNAFWSLTMYDPTFFFVPNVLNRYTLSPRTALDYNEDGSLSLYVQHSSPGKDKESNWLPAPKGKFALMLRMYWPKEVLLDGTWKPAPVKRVGKDTPEKPKGPTDALSAAEVRKIAEEAYVYGFPMVINYGTLYETAIDKSGKQYKGPFNTIVNNSQVFTPKDTVVVTPNSDTPYSSAWLDLRAEPMVLCVPEVEERRYYSVQLVDLYTFNYGYIGSRTTGNGPGCYLVAGPRWRGAIPKGIDRVFRCETEVSFAIYRTQLFNSGDLANVKKVQAGYKVQPLSAFLKSEPPPAPPPPAFPRFDKKAAFGAGFIGYLNFILRGCPVEPQDKELRERFAKIGIGGGKAFDFARLSPEHQKAIRQGIQAALGKIARGSENIGKEANGWRIGGLAGGNRAFYKGDWLLRAAVARAGIYANDKAEALYPLLTRDSAGGSPDCGKHRYTLTFPKGQLPPVNAFWSVTMYDRKSQLLVANPINRYLINSPMLPGLKKNADGSLTIYIQKDAPGKDREPNWLPAPDGPIYVVMRLYWPKREALTGKWVPPVVKRVP